MRIWAAAAAFTVSMWLAAPAAAETSRPVVVELYTAQGCAACLQANQTANQLAERDGVLVLAFPVDYWDYLGWKDTYARRGFAARQRAYAQRRGRRGVSTPQVIVDGALFASGASRTRTDQLISEARRTRPEAPEMLFREDGRLAIGSGPRPKAGAEVWLVRLDPRARRVTVRKGENRGKTVVQRNVVRQLVRLGAWQGRPAVFTLPQGRPPTLESYVLLQERGGRIIGVLAEPDPAPAEAPAASDDLEKE